MDYQTGYTDCVSSGVNSASENTAPLPSLVAAGIINIMLPKIITDINPNIII
ncbi:MAG: hypothetical protein ACLUFX_01310 [Oscillospiraceae bacterium]|nr:hypothetical protein [Ruminococcus sp.]